MADVKFHNYSVEVKNAIDKLAYNVLDEVAGEIESQIKQNTPTGRVAGGQLKDSWQHKVRKKGDGNEATIGSSLERAYWVEFGTGDYAIPESGKPSRKGGWFIPVGNGKGYISETVAKAYRFRIRKGSGGKRWVFTLGMKPKRPVQKAYSRLKNKMIRHMQDVFKGGLS